MAPLRFLISRSKATLTRKTTCQARSMKSSEDLSEEEEAATAVAEDIEAAAAEDMATATDGAAAIDKEDTKSIQ